MKIKKTLIFYLFIMLAVLSICLAARSQAQIKESAIPLNLQSAAKTPTDKVALAELYLIKGEYDSAKELLEMTKSEIGLNDNQSDLVIRIEQDLGFIATGDKMNPFYISIFSFLILIFSIILHEYMHGAMAYRLGDSTAYNAGRLSFNPIAHIDPMGSVILPLILILSKADFLIGWAKPVPINPLNFKKPRRDDVLVSFAGPLANIILAFLSLFLLAVCGYLIKQGGLSTLHFSSLSYDTLVAGGNNALLWTYIINALKYGVIINCIIAGFNLLPIPPLDGSHILMAILPFKWLRVIYGYITAFGMMIIMLLAFTGWLNVLLFPALLVIYIAFSLIGHYFGLN